MTAPITSKKYRVLARAEEQTQMPITMDGQFLAWRLVKDD
jgi:hypothetical protein